MSVNRVCRIIGSVLYFYEKSDIITLFLKAFSVNVRRHSSVQKYTTLKIKILFSLFTCLKVFNTFKNFYFLKDKNFYKRHFTEITSEVFDVFQVNSIIVNEC